MSRSNEFPRRALASTLLSMPLMLAAASCGGGNGDLQNTDGGTASGDAGIGRLHGNSGAGSGAVLGASGSTSGGGGQSGTVGGSGAMSASGGSGGSASGLPASRPGTNPTVTAAGNLPAGVPSELLVGLFEETDGTWMKESGVPWQARYRYITKNWVNNWGWGDYDGGFATWFFEDCDRNGYVPALAYYQMNGHGPESAFYALTQDAEQMKTYFGDFKILMQRVKDFKKPVFVLLEADGPGLLESQTDHNPNAPAAVATTGLPELAGLPNTAAGWLLSFLQIRKSVGATNAILGMHISGWSSGKDIAHYSVTDPLEPEVDKVYEFLKPGGLGPNVTGETYDVLVGDPLDRDADYYRLERDGDDRWWDPADDAPVSSKSFNRYAAWLKAWNEKSGKRWVLWQIPLGNSNHPNVCNEDGPHQGYKDNRTEYFFGPSRDAHLLKFANAGVIAMLFGPGAGCQSSYQNDLGPDGQPYLKTQVGAFLRGGGLKL